jgi:transcriptional regulator with XRE-family HTH domain
MKAALNLIGPQVRKWRVKKGWSQQALATKLQLRGWNVSRDSLANLESQRRVRLEDLFPKNIPLGKIGPEFQSGQKLAIFPTRVEK